MGKIRVKTLGDEELEKKQKQKTHEKAEQKKLVKGAKGGERIVSVGPSEEELAKLSASEKLSPSAHSGLISGSKTDGSVAAREASDKKTITTQAQKKKKHRKTKERSRSKSYQAVAKTLDKSKKYSLLDGLEILENLKRSKFDETVELHINTIETGVSGNITFPHGTGKQIRVAIADPSASRRSPEGNSGQVDALLKKIEQGDIDFDVLLATPEAMPKLARVAKILGPRGLMPNPKNGTLTKDPQTLALSFAKGQMNFKTEAKAPIMHLTVGKMSFGTKKLSENINALIESVKKEKIRNVTLKSTMSPGIKLDLGS